MQVDTLMNVRLGQKMLRRKTGDTDTWVDFTVNDTYWELMIEFPEDYKHLDGMPVDVWPVI